MNKKDCFKPDKENQAKNTLLNIIDDSFQYQNQKQPTYHKNLITKQTNQQKYTFFQRLSKSKQKRRCLRQIRVNSNSDMKTEQIKKIPNNKYLFTSQKDNEHPIQTIKQLKKILEKLQSKQIKQTDTFLLAENKLAQFKKTNRTNSVHKKRRDLSFINNKSQNQFQICISDKQQQTNLVIIKNCKNKQKLMFFNANEDQIRERKHSLGINYFKNGRQIKKLRNKQSLVNQFNSFGSIKNNIDNLSSKTLNILHQLNNLKSLNYKNKQKFHIKVNKKNKMLNPQHFLSVRI